MKKYSHKIKTNFRMSYYDMKNPCFILIDDTRYQCLYHCEHK